MELSFFFWEATGWLVTEKFTKILWNPKVHYRVHNSLPLVHILSQINLVCTRPSNFSEIHFIIIFPPYVYVFLALC
jgi:hypothetical protein